MIERKYYCDDGLEYRSYGIFDLSKANKSMNDFRDEDGICSWQFGNYLVEETDSMLTGDEVVNKLNEQEERIKRIKKYIDKEIKQREEDLQKSVKAGMPTGSFYYEIELLEEIQKIINNGDTK